MAATSLSFDPLGNDSKPSIPYTGYYVTKSVTGPFRDTGRFLYDTYIHVGVIRNKLHILSQQSIYYGVATLFDINMCSTVFYRGPTKKDLGERAGKWP